MAPGGRYSMLETKISTESVLLTPGEVAALLRVAVTTLARWEKGGALRCVRTPGGHRRFLRADVEKLLNTMSDA